MHDPPRILLTQLDEVWHMLKGRPTGRRVIDSVYEGKPGQQYHTL
jgi:hypothetical protein